MLDGEFLTRWTVRAALLCYAAALALLMLSGSHFGKRAARWAWTLGCLIFLAHVAAAFHFFHRWSHSAAYADTARQTAEVTGWNFGGGLWLNYAFALLWTADVILWWTSRSRPPLERGGRGGRTAVERSCSTLPYATGLFSAGLKWPAVALHAFMAFMIVNATIVFETGPTRWVSLAVASVLILLAACSLLRKP